MAGKTEASPRRSTFPKGRPGSFVDSIPIAAWRSSPWSSRCAFWSSCPSARRKWRRRPESCGAFRSGLHLMAARRIQSCWSTDFHLGLTGVALLIHQIW